MYIVRPFRSSCRTEIPRKCLYVKSGVRPPCRVYTCTYSLPINLSPYPRIGQVLTQCISSRYIRTRLAQSHTYIHTYIHNLEQAPRDTTRNQAPCYTYHKFIYVKGNRKTGVHASNVSGAYLCIGLRCAAHVASPRAAEIVPAATALRTFLVHPPRVKGGRGAGAGVAM